MRSCPNIDGTYGISISINDIFFSTDCIKTLSCIAKKCSTMGGVGDYCRDYKDCRLLLYYKFSISFKYQTLISSLGEMGIVTKRKISAERKKGLEESAN